MMNNLLKNLIVATLIVFTVGVGGVKAQEVKSDLPSCKGTDSSKWDKCFGSIEYTNGEKYIGEFARGKYDGEGAFYFSVNDKFNREKYLGSYKNNLKNGYGFFSWKKSGYYAGWWVNDLYNGSGMLVYPVTGDYYDGLFVNGKRHGKGTYTKLGGEKIEGIWKDDKFTQASSKKNEELDKKLEINELASARNKINNKLPNCVGKYSLKWTDCFGKWIANVDFAGLLFNNEKQEQYIGQFKNGLKHGKGIFYYKNGDEFIGEWRNNLPNGDGTLISKYGVVLTGKWLNGKKNGKVIENDKNDGNYLAILNYEDDELNGEQFYKNKYENYSINFNHGVEEGLTYSNGDRHDSVGKHFVKNNNEAKDNIKYYSFTIYKKDNEKSFSVVRGDNIITQVKKINGNLVIGELKKDGFFAFENQENSLTELKEIIKIIQNNNSDYFKLDKKYNNIVDKEILKKIGLEDIFDEYKNRLSLQVTNTQANAEGDFVINIQTGTDTASLKINGEEQGGRADGNYTIKKVARAGQETKFVIIAKDTNGNTDAKTISVTRQVPASSQVKYAELNPTLVKNQPNKDAVAIIIGIADYKNLPRADYANDDARAFYDYAIRALGVKAENIKLLVDADAGQGEIYKAFKTWLPSRVKATTDVYVYYSGHGLPAADGQSLYLLPQLADRDLIEETAIAQSKINAAIQAAKPKSVTIFLDSCYSGAGRTGATLLASARPIAIKSTAQTFPAEFIVISASTAEQISSSSNELKHGIFSYYLMRGMEGEADTNKDGKITTGEMHTYLTENVAKQASLANRVQQPQLSGDANRVLVGR